MLPGRPLLSRSCFVLLVAVAALRVPAQAQSMDQPGTPAPTAQPPIRVEVASIRPHSSTGDEPSDRRVLPGGRFVATATTVRTLIRVAFMTDDSLISGAPGWVDKMFDINATTADHAEIATPEQLQQFLLSLLEDRFQLRFHRERREGSVYWLELDKAGKIGPGLKASTSESHPAMSTNANGARANMTASNMTMADIAATLRRQAGRPVEDHTGLTGKYDFQIEWSRQESPESPIPSLFTVLKEQLGLKLRPAKGSFEHIVIDQINEPSEN